MGKKRLKESWIHDFSEHFAGKLSPAGTGEVLREMLRRGLADPVKVRDYLVVRDYPGFIVRNQGHMMDAIYQLADKYCISERLVQRIIYQWRSAARKGQLTLHKGDSL